MTTSTCDYIWVDVLLSNTVKYIFNCPNALHAIICIYCMYIYIYGLNWLKVIAKMAQKKCEKVSLEEVSGIICLMF